jgi:hypothetical protein
LKALAALHGLEKAARLGMTRIILKTDVTNLGKVLATNLMDRGLEELADPRPADPGLPHGLIDADSPM